MTPLQKYTRLRPAAKKIIMDYALRRGVPSDDLHDYLEPGLRLESGSLPEVDQFIVRLTTAVKNQERILIFGDYDADGITAVAILLRCLREIASLTPMWALPNRQKDQYGLDLQMAKRLHAQQRPDLLICLDNGTNSAEAVTWLREQGVDTIIVDHHPLDGTIPDAVAVVNPKLTGRDCNDSCAAGLVLQVCHEIARAWNAEAKWDRDTAIILAGLGTVADSVAMTPHNRALVKTAITLLNTSSKVEAIKGLAALLATGLGKLDQRRLQFDIIPALNAPGRLHDAETVVTLLTTSDDSTAKNIARYCREQNELRKKLQRVMVQQAQVLASIVVSEHPETPVLVLAEKSWQHGVAGPAASQIAELFNRSAILLAPYKDHQWKGSGRSANGDNLGRWLRNAKQLGLCERGGGHTAAIGLAATHAQLAPLQSAGIFLEMPQSDHEPEQESIGDVDQLRPEEWLAVTELLSPCGRKNPFPIVNAHGAVCDGEPTALISKEDKKPWAFKARFRGRSGNSITVSWRNCVAARKQWRAGARCDLVLELSTQAKGGRTFYNWSVIFCQPSWQKRGENPERSLATDGFQPSPRRADFQIGSEKA
jgi:single-stranded-DNA-specific exonuclease